MLITTNIEIAILLLPVVIYAVVSCTKIKQAFSRYYIPGICSTVNIRDRFTLNHYSGSGTYITLSYRICAAYTSMRVIDKRFASAAAKSG